MNEEIRKNAEIRDDALENVSGGAEYSKLMNCICGGILVPCYNTTDGVDIYDFHFCGKCGLTKKV